MTTTALPQPRVIDALDVHVALTEYNGKHGIDIREWYEESNPPYALKPGRKGIRIPVAYLDDLIAHLTALRAEALALDLIEVSA